MNFVDFFGKGRRPRGFGFGWVGFWSVGIKDQINLHECLEKILINITFDIQIYNWENFKLMTFFIPLNNIYFKWCTPCICTLCLSCKF